jgi:hypothetical protein
VSDGGVDDLTLRITRWLEDGQARERIEAPASTWAQALIYHRRKPLRLHRHPFVVPIYNSSRKRLLFKTARQVAKSTTLCNILLVRSFLTPAMRTLYVSPSAAQTRQFSNEKIRPALADSPLVQKYFFNERTCINQTYEKSFTNGSHMFLRYAFLSADRARGIPSELLCLDEVQDILKDNTRVIAESLSATGIMDDTGSEMGVEIQAGTPKTFENTIEDSWKISSQNEWFVPCDRHTPVHWNYLDINVIGKEGPICTKCGGPINPLQGQWVTMNPDGEYWGFRISQLMVPWKLHPLRWSKEIVFKMENWPEAQFSNEVLGLSYDNARKPIGRADLQRCCWPVNKQEPLDTSKYVARANKDTMRFRVFAGVDWGEGRAEGKTEHGKKRHASFTVFTAGAYVTSDKWWTIYQKRYVGKEIDPEFIKRDIIRLMQDLRVEVLGADWGHGWGINSWLFKQLGQTKVMQLMYSDSIGERKKWDPDRWCFVINRNAVISDLLEDLKAQKILLPEWVIAESYAEDILGIYADYNSRTRKTYFDHPLDQPDDSLHSLAYARLAANIDMGRF